MRYLCWIFFGVFTILHAETYSEWLAQQPQNPPVQIEFIHPEEKKLDEEHYIVSEKIKNKEVNYYIPQAPTAGFIGNLRITAAQGVEFPLRVTFYTSKIEQDDLVKQQALKKGSKFTWGKPSGLLNPRAHMSSGNFSKTIQIEGNSKVIPVVLTSFIGQGQLFRGYGNYNNIHSQYMEIRDAKNQILYRGLIAEAFIVGYSQGAEGGIGFVSERNKEADRHIREKVAKEIRSFIKMPADLAVYDFSVKSLWLSEEDLGADVVTPDFLRKYILMGGNIYGKKQDAIAVRKWLGLQDDEIEVGLGSIQDIEKAEVKNHSRYEEMQFGDQFKKYDKWEIARKDLFKPYEKTYLVWSIASVVIFAVISIILIPLGFIYLKGSRRVYLWVLIPIIVAFFTLTSFAIGKLILPTTMRAEMVEYRMARQGWSEVLSTGIAEILPMKSEKVSLEAMISHACFSPKNQYGVSSSTKTFSSEKLSTLEFINFPRGHMNETIWKGFIQATPPISLQSSNTIRFAQEMENVWIFYRDKQHKWEKIDADSTVTLDDFLKRPIEKEASGEICKNCGKHHRDSIHGMVDEIKTTAEKQNQIIVMGMVKDNFSVRVPNSTSSNSKIIWCVYLPLSSTPKSGDVQ